MQIKTNQKYFWILSRSVFNEVKNVSIEKDLL